MTWTLPWAASERAILGPPSFPVDVRVMGVDFGERRIGVALSDPTGRLASPHGTVKRRAGKRWPLAALEGIARTHGVTHLVVGLPLSAAGIEDEWCARVREAGSELGRRLRVTVDYVDERMTSARATKALQEAQLPRARRRDKGLVDAAAAAVILQAFLDRQASSASTPSDPRGPKADR